MIYEFYNPWSGFNRGSLAWCWNVLHGTLRTRWACPPSTLGIFNRTTGKWVVHWEGGRLYLPRGVVKERRWPLPWK